MCRLFMRLSLMLCRCDAEWWCRWLYNIVRFGACASRVLQGFKTNLVTVNDSFEHHNTTSTKGTKKNAGIERSKKKKREQTNNNKRNRLTRKEQKKKAKKNAGIERSKKKTRNKNKPATEKRKERKKNSKCKWIAHSCNFYLSLLFKLIIIVKD